MPKTYPPDYKGPQAGRSTLDEWLDVRDYQAYKWIADGTWSYSDFDCWFYSWLLSRQEKANKSTSSLGGENTGRRAGGVRSSRTSSTTLSQLKKLDMQIAKIDERIHQLGWLYGPSNKEWLDLKKKRAKLDEKRKQVRLKRKQHNGTQKAGTKKLPQSQKPHA